jgi:hypothetical protein
MTSNLSIIRREASFGAALVAAGVAGRPALIRESAVAVLARDPSDKNDEKPSVWRRVNITVPGAFGGKANQVDQAWQQHAKAA